MSMELEGKLLSLFRAFCSYKNVIFSEVNPELIDELRKCDISDYSLYEDFVIDLENEDIRLIAVDFYKYLKSNGYNLNSNLDEYRFYKSDVTARRLDILKELHKEVSKNYLAKRYAVDEKVIRNDIDALQFGTKLLGVEIKLGASLERPTKNGKSYYFCKETAHPFFLILNLTQVFSLVTYVERLGRTVQTPPYESSVLKNVVDIIKNQCSNYACDKLGFWSNTEVVNCFVDEQKMVDGGFGEYERLLKTCRKFEIEYEGKKYVGCFEADCFKTEDGEVIEIKNKSDLKYRIISD